MVPTRNLLHHDGKNSGKPWYHPAQYCVGIAAQLEASATAAARQGHHHKPVRSPRLAMPDDDEMAAAGTSSRGGGAGAGDDGDWLQLGLAAAPSSSTASSSGDNNSMDPPGVHDKRSTRTMRPPAPLFPLPLRSYQSYGHSRYRPMVASGSMSSVPFLPFTPPLRTSDDAMRVISPPARRTEATELWLILQAAPNQVREPILPQIPKSYLRIKDSKNMKVEVVMKYLVDKLGLARSHQVELTCRGQLLPPFLLLKYVRDSIWCSSSALVARRSPTSTTDHVMTLCYSTSREQQERHLL